MASIPFINDSKSYKARGIRNILKFYVYFILGTGVRSGEEIVNLKYGDIKLGILNER